MYVLTPGTDLPATTTIPRRLSQAEEDLLGGAQVLDDNGWLKGGWWKIEEGRWPFARKQHLFCARGALTWHITDGLTGDENGSPTAVRARVEAAADLWYERNGRSIKLHTFNDSRAKTKQEVVASMRQAVPGGHHG